MTTVCVADVPSECTTPEMLGLFEACGRIRKWGVCSATKIHVMEDGVCYTYVRKEDAESAAKRYDGFIIQGKKLRVWVSTYDRQ